MFVDMYFSVIVQNKEFDKNICEDDSTSTILNSLGFMGEFGCEFPCPVCDLNV